MGVFLFLPGKIAFGDSYRHALFRTVISDFLNLDVYLLVDVIHSRSNSTGYQPLCSYSIMELFKILAISKNSARSDDDELFTVGGRAWILLRAVQLLCKSFTSISSLGDRIWNNAAPRVVA